MYICKVVGKVVATIRNPRLGPSGLILVQRLGAGGQEGGELLVAADPIGCGDGDTILVTGGANARYALGEQEAPVDLAVVGIVDSYAENTAPASPKTQAASPKNSKQQNRKSSV